MKTAFLAPDGFEMEVLHEISSFPQAKILGQWERLFYVEGIQHLSFSQNTWLEPQVIEFESIGQAAKKLKAIGKIWSLYSITSHRRAQLIQEKLISPKAKKIKFLQEIKFPPLSAWSLIESNKILASAKTTSPFHLGEFEFEENKTEPPSRAYLKLWEFMTLTRAYPKPQSLCLDLGSSPGGWTWVLNQLQCRIISVDKAPLTDSLQNLKNIQWLKKNAFEIMPSELPEVEWLFSDIICEPQKLYDLIIKWKNSGRVKNFICTIKFKANADFELVKKFAAIPGSQILHLCHNKHELTWYCLEHSPKSIFR